MGGAQNCAVPVGEPLLLVRGLPHHFSDGSSCGLVPTSIHSPTSDPSMSFPKRSVLRRPPRGLIWHSKHLSATRYRRDHRRLQCGDCLPLKPLPRRRRLLLRLRRVAVGFFSAWHLSPPVRALWLLELSFISIGRSRMGIRQWYQGFQRLRCDWLMLRRNRNQMRASGKVNLSQRTGYRWQTATM